MLNRVLAGTEHRHVFKTNLETVVDIGANRGQFALAVRRWAPKARIVSFEPLNDAANTFRNVFKKDSGVILHQAAIGPQAGEATIHVTAADDSSSLLPISPFAGAVISWNRRNPNRNSKDRPTVRLCYA